MHDGIAVRILHMDVTQVGCVARIAGFEVARQRRPVQPPHEKQPKEDTFQDAHEAGYESEKDVEKDEVCEDKKVCRCRM